MPVNKTEAMSQALIHVADKLGYGVRELYQVYTKGQAVEGMVTLGSLAFVLAVGAVVSGVAYRILSKKEGEVMRECAIGSDKKWEKNDTLRSTAIAGFVAFFIAVFVVSVAQPAVLKILAPEYMAAKELVQAAGGVVG